MNPHRFLSASVAAATLLAACGTVSLDETDHDALFVGARVEKRLSGTAVHDGTHLEAEWRMADGETEALDYSIETLALGFGVDRTVGEHGWIGAVGGLAWQGADFDTTPDELEDLNGVGPYFALQAGWLATPWFEPYARAGGSLYFPEFGNELSVEAGARFHAFEHASLFVGWRYASYEFGDFDPNALGVDTLELDTSGLVVMLQLGF
ncbi:MAG: hypothetical protein HZA52_13410 [Planctomycetes bacterium]|nr:hypothetical protein [Planctomycetota bacterium]